ncbi:MAG: DUF3048 C-terminal domain-containing protein [Anaerolineae bacterium]|jgi:hypothetical protein|nr:DUF3048 domain-containing protein [Chloroflexota bacterium]
MTTGVCKRPLAACLLTSLLLAGVLLMSACTGGEPVGETPVALTVTVEATPEPTTPAPTATATPTPTSTPTPTITPTPTRADNISPLTGLEADPALLHRRVIAFRVGNDPAIRPQEGLGAADVVIEEMTEGHVTTRFTALFLESEAERVRPLRSARLTTLEIAPQYGAAMVHTGASDGVRWRLSQTTIVNLDQWFHPAPYGVAPGYDYRGRMYSSTERVRTYLEDKGLERTDLIEGYVFDPEPPRGESALDIHIPYPSASVDWNYDPETGLYLRKVSNRPHVDALTNEQITAANIVLFYTEHIVTDIIEDSNGARALDIVMHGEGPAVVIRDGVRVEGQWRRLAEDEVILYWDENDEVIPFKPGKTWIELMPLDHEVTIDEPEADAEE